MVDFAHKNTLSTLQKGVLRSSQTSMMGLSLENNWRLKDVNYFFLKFNRSCFRES